MATPQKIRCQVQQITAHGDHVYTVDLTPERPVPRFRPGQFLHLTLDDYDPSGFCPNPGSFPSPVPQPSGIISGYPIP